MTVPSIESIHTRLVVCIRCVKTEVLSSRIFNIFSQKVVILLAIFFICNFHSQLHILPKGEAIVALYGL